MSVYCITYKLNNAFRNYSTFYEAIKSSGTWWEQYDNVWFIGSSNNSEYVRDYLFQFMANNDKLFVIEVNGNWAGIGHTDEEYNWLNNNIS